MLKTKIDLDSLCASARRGGVALLIGIVVTCGALLGSPVAMATETGTDVFGRPASPVSPTAASAPAVDDATPRHTLALPEPVRAVLAAGILWQGELNADIEDAASALQHGTSARIWATLLLMSFAYGVLHAIGPGHGKLVVGTWLGSRGSRVAQAMLLSGWTATVQALSAIVLVLGAAWLTDAGVSTVLTHAASLEVVSYGLLCVAGLWTLRAAWVRADCCFDPAAIRLVPETRGKSRQTSARWLAGRSIGASADARPDDGSDDDSDDGENGEDSASETTRYLGANLAARMRANGSSMRLGPARRPTTTSLLATGLAAGVRPCVGAIFVLVSAVAAQVPWVGIASAFAMAGGVAITVCIVGLTGVGANRLLIGRSMRWRNRAAAAQRGLSMAGAIAITAFAAVQLVLLLTGYVAPSLT